MATTCPSSGSRLPAGSPADVAAIRRILAALPADAADRVAALRARTGAADLGSLRARLLGYVAGASSTTTCDPTEFDTWVAGSVSGLTLDDLLVIVLLGVDQWPALDALLYGSPGDPAYGLGSRTHVLTKAVTQTKRFWNVNTSDVQLLGMHGSMLLDKARVKRLVKVLFEVGDDEADHAATEMVTLLSAPRFHGGNLPILTLNAFAFSSKGAELFPGSGIIPDKLIVGDGILVAFDELGLGDVAPQALVAHEMGHHVQFELGMAPGGTAAGNRRVELHADASAAYVLAHPRGMSMQWKRVQRFESVYADLGDCFVDSPLHHGTAAQRARAAQWGYLLEEGMHPASRVLGASGFASLFEGALPAILAG